MSPIRSLIPTLSVSVRERVSPHGLSLARAIAFAAAFIHGAGAIEAAEFTDLEPILQKQCVECHGSKEPEGSLVLESYTDLLKGGESGAVLVIGKSADSLLIKVLEGNWGKTGKNQFMPPGKRDHLEAEKIALFKAWIDAGAPEPKSGAASASAALVVPSIPIRGTPRRPINSLAFEPKTQLLAVARPTGVELLAVDTQTIIRTLPHPIGPVNAVTFSSDGQFVFAGAGQPGQSGEIRQWRTASGELVRVFSGPRDAVQSLALNPDATVVAGGSYDYGIFLWGVSDGGLRRTITAHQGAVMELAFRPDGKILASASFDRTAKLYDPISGIRVETLGQALNELNALAFSPDGQTLLTGGNDHRIRAYHVGLDGKEGSNELMATVFAHEGSLLKLAYSPDGKTVASAADDQTVKLFSVPELIPRLRLEPQPDWPTALTFLGSDRLAVGRADGSLGLYQTSDGKRWSPPPPPKPELAHVEPRGIQNGVETKLTITGKNLLGARVVGVYTDHLIAAVRPETGTNGVTFTYTVAADQPRGPLEFSVTTSSGESGRIKVWVDELPQSTETILHLPVDAWGVLAHSGQSAEFQFEASTGQTLLFDLAADRLGTRGDYNLTLVDAADQVLAFNDTYADQTDPLLIQTFATAGTYKIRVAEANFGGSPEHAFRLTIGELPFVTGLFPLILSSNSESEVEFTGPNLPPNGHLRVMAGAAGSLELPPETRSWRYRHNWKLTVTDQPTFEEAEPNGATTDANPVPLPAIINGRLNPPGDVDLYRFPTQIGQTYLLETAAARRGSTADTRIEVLWPDGRPVELVRLQAVRNSAVTFRATDANGTGIRFVNWEEMALNELLFCGGEVMKILRAPQGPDSDSMMYSSKEKRRAWFDTTAAAHYLDEPVYVVKPLSPGVQPVANGLPVFTLNHLNDDAALRDLGTDSRLYFQAPVTGDFLVRVDDPQGGGGPQASYALTLRLANPDFSVRLNGPPEKVARGSGQPFSVTVDRHDGFEGPVELEFLHLPPGWSVSHPIRIEAGHESASLTLNADSDANQPDDATWDAVRVVAAAKIGGQTSILAANNLGHPHLTTEIPKLLVSLSNTDRSTNASPLTVALHPGGTARAKLQLKRNGFEGVVVFNIENLPHGVIVENLGLNGITFLADETEREISFAAAAWVSDLDRPFYAVENQAGRQTSTPLQLQVRRPGTAQNLNSMPTRK